MSPERAVELVTRAIAMKKIEPKMKVDLVADTTGKVLFYIPTAEVPEKEELNVRLKEAEKTVDELRKKVSELEKRKEK